jgi:hypothetical protein
MGALLGSHPFRWERDVPTDPVSWSVHLTSFRPKFLGDHTRLIHLFATRRASLEIPPGIGGYEKGGLSRVDWCFAIPATGVTMPHGHLLAPVVCRSVRRRGGYPCLGSRAYNGGRSRMFRSSPAYAPAARCSGHTRCSRRGVPARPRPPGRPATPGRPGRNRCRPHRREAAIGPNNRGRPPFSSAS